MRRKSQPGFEALKLIEITNPGDRRAIVGQKFRRFPVLRSPQSPSTHARTENSGHSDCNGYVESLNV
jgi:hypothetical protein